jgi:GAF domain-containing protein
LGAKRCDIWRFDPDKPELFYGAGASYKGFESETPPRKGGWSDYVCRAKCSVWINDIRSRFSFDVAFWDEQSQSWCKRPVKSGTPEAVNQRVIDLKVGSELGAPILCDGEAVGIAWLKYDEADHPKLAPDEMMLVKQFAEGVGKVLKSLAFGRFDPTQSSAQL